MNQSETKAYNWLNKQGYQNITFQHSLSPDFITESGERFEVKKVRNNTIWFSPRQHEVLSAMKDVKVILMNNADEPYAVFLFSEIKDGFWRNIKITGINADTVIRNIRFPSDMIARMQSRAVKEERSVNYIVVRAVNIYLDSVQSNSDSIEAKVDRLSIPGVNRGVIRA